MAKTTLKHKTALILGADSPVGRAVALQLAREGCHVVLAGFDEQKISLLEDLIKNKKGDAFPAVLPRSADRAIAVLRPVRDAQGHLHFVINALGAAEPPADRPEGPGEEAVIFHEKIVELVSGRGTIRFVFVWPDAQGAVPSFAPEGVWRCVVRAKNLQTDIEHEDNPETVRAAAAADTIVNLIQCPAGACPSEVRLETTELKG